MTPSNAFPIYQRALAAGFFRVDRADNNPATQPEGR